MHKLLSFDVYGTLINTSPINAKAFRLLLEQAGASNIDALAFYQFWESRNIVHYREPYRSYREIGELSLEEAFENFGVVGGTADLIEPLLPGSNSTTTAHWGSPPNGSVRIGSASRPDRRPSGALAAKEGVNPIPARTPRNLRRFSPP
jgi:hypothetical protein